MTEHKLIFSMVPRPYVIQPSQELKEISKLDKYPGNTVDKLPVWFQFIAIT